MQLHVLTDSQGGRGGEGASLLCAKYKSQCGKNVVLFHAGMEVCQKSFKKNRVRILMTVSQYAIFTIHGRLQNKKGDMGKSESEKKSFRHRFSLLLGAGETKLSPKLLL